MEVRSPRQLAEAGVCPPACLRGSTWAAPAGPTAFRKTRLMNFDWMESDLIVAHMNADELKGASGESRIGQFM